MEKFGNQSVTLTCLSENHLRPNVVNTFPFERLAHAVLAWAQVRAPNAGHVPSLSPAPAVGSAPPLPSLAPSEKGEGVGERW